ncbi:MAG: GNAT family N-acetyltransferase [Bacteroidetes bacterium]|nr:GNAT family N-acetyltransferase [Bacteroidota bacterium]
MQAIVVSTGKTEREFIEFPKRLYSDDPNWVCPLDSEVRSLFTPSGNSTFRHGEAVRWILTDSGGKTIGRVAAFIDKIRSSAQSQPTGGMGFFEVIENRDAAWLLFNTAADWLKERGMEAMDGPVNFGENESNWGLLVEGFTHPGIGMPYHKKYYKAFFEEFGFRNYFEQYSYHRDIGSVEVFPERFMKIAEWISRRPGYSFRHFRYSERKKFVNDLVEIYNTTWASFKEDFTPLETGLLEASLNKAKAFIDEELIWFAYHNDKPVAFYVIFPDLNMILRHLNGKLHPLNMLRFLWYKRRHEMTRIRALVAGIVPSHQNSGIESAIFYQLYKVFRKKRYYKELELSWVGDYNPKMISIYEAIGATRAKTHITYRYMINKDLTFRRFIEEKSAAANGVDGKSE